jgi:hypothetical protein
MAFPDPRILGPGRFFRAGGFYLPVKISEPYMANASTDKQKHDVNVKRRSI